MCEANVFMVREGKDELLMETVTVVRTEGDEVVMNNLFGEQKRVRGRLTELNLEGNRVVIEPL